MKWPRDQRLLFVTSEGLTVYFRDKKNEVKSLFFSARPDGISSFSSFIAEHPRVETRMLVDLVEEEFRFETVPHVLTQRDQLMQRTAQRLFRTAVWRRWRIVGREQQGRRDDRVLFSALTNTELLTPWLAVLQRHKIPLSAIHSSPYLLAKILKPFGLGKKSMLLLSQDREGRLRQTFFRDGRLATSRLSPGVMRDDPRRYADFLISEIEKTRHYLQRLQLLPFDAVLDALLLEDDSRLAALGEIKPSPNISIKGRSLAEVSTSLGFAHEKGAHHANLLLCQLALVSSDAGYARREDRRYAIHRQIEQGLNLSFVVVLLLCLTGAATLLLANTISRQQYEVTSRTASSYERLVEKKRAAGGIVDEHEAEMVQAAVQGVTWLVQRQSTPKQFLPELGAIMQDFPEFSLQLISWQRELGDSATGDATVPPPGDAPSPINSETALPITDDIRHSLTLSGTILLPDGDLRQGVRRLTALTELLPTKLPQVTGVHIIRQESFDFDPQGTLQGKAAEVRRELPFAVRITLSSQPAAGDAMRVAIPEVKQ